MSDERIAIVTGGSRGIGRAVVEALAGDGWRIYFCSKSADSVESAAKELTGRFGDRIAGRPVDVREQDQVDAFTDWVAGEGGGVDCLVNNAGLGRFGAVDELSGDQWREVLRTNLDGCFYFIRAVAPVMKRRGGGTILNVASLAARNPFAGGSAYNASKFGLLGLSDAAMLDLRHDGVRVAAILPGSVETEFHRTRRDDTSWMLSPEDVARACLDVLAYPDRSLASRIELRPSRPPKR
jgi:NAD(P)-dependent dehydrogenase (short-subunit alcohol dehydrogenase family)